MILYDELVLVANVYQRMVVLALVELGRVTELECMWEDCPFESRRFDTLDSPTRRLRLEIDHITSMRTGGTEHPSNLRLIHRWCNSTRTAREMAADPAMREHLSMKAKERWGTPDSPPIGGSWTNERRAAWSEHMRQRYNDPVFKEKHAQALRAGKRWKKEQE